MAGLHDLLRAARTLLDVTVKTRCGDEGMVDAWNGLDRAVAACASYNAVVENEDGMCCCACELKPSGDGELRVKTPCLMHAEWKGDVEQMAAVLERIEKLESTVEYLSAQSDLY